MKVMLADTAGFCMGVGLALKKLDQVIENTEKGRVYILGPIIHNPQVLEYYEKLGVVLAKTPEDVPAGANVVIRAHGIPREVEEDLKGRGVVVRDATCPKVRKAQLLIGRHTADNRDLLLFGEADHPEVRGLVSYAIHSATVFENIEDLDISLLSEDKSYVLAAQTTQDRVAFNALCESLRERPELDVLVLNTICDATRRRQQEALELASQVDYMVVVGGYDSGNTRRLCQVVREHGIPCAHVERFAELDLQEIGKFASVGITAGASTPRDIISEVFDGLHNLG